MFAPLSQEQILDFEYACARDSVLCGERKSFFRDFKRSISHLVQEQPPTKAVLQHLPGMGDDKYEVTVTQEGARLGKPYSMSRTGDVDFALTPGRCRRENSNFSAPLYITISVTTQAPTIENSLGVQCRGSNHEFYLCDIPVMVDNESLGGDLYANGEIDDGGYFIVKGKERIIPMHRSSDPYATVCYVNESTNTVCIAVRSGYCQGKNQSTRVSVSSDTAPMFMFWKGTATPAKLLRCLGVDYTALETLHRADGEFYNESLLEDDEDKVDLDGLFPGTEKSKKAAAVVSTLRMLRFMHDTEFYTERDSVLSQTVEGVSELLTTVFKRALKSTMTAVRMRLEARLRKIHNLRNDQKNHRSSSLAIPTAKSVGKIMFDSNNVGSRIMYFVSTGNLVGGGDSKKSTGMCQLLERTSRLQKESGMQKIVTGLDSQNAPVSAREFSLCSLGRICPVSTPEGKRCGLVGQKALGARVSRDRSSAVSAIRGCVARFLCACSGEEGSVKATHTAAVWISGVFLSLSENPKGLVETLRAARREGQIPRDVGVSLHGNGTVVVWVEIRVHAGRLLRPLMPLDKLRPGMPKGTTWSRYCSEGYIEMLDAREEMTALVAQVEEHATKEHTHRELFRAAALGCVPSCIPFLDHEPCPRASYFTNQAQQTMGWDPRVFANRMSDSKAFQMWYPQKSLVNTSFEHSSRADETAPQGQNVCIAVMSFQGSEEDAIIVSRRAVEFGLFRATQYSVKTITTADRDKKCFAFPGRSGGLSSGSFEDTPENPKWAALDKNTGIARVGKRLRTGDALAGIADAKRVKVVKHNASLPAVVDRVLVFDEHASGHRTAKNSDPH